MAQLELRQVTKTFTDTTVIHGVELHVADGEFCVFVGPSGCGKSTLLRMIAGLEECTSGQVLFDQTDVTDEQPAKRGIAMVFQSYALYPHMSLYDNMAFGLQLKKMPKDEVDRLVQHAAKILGIEHLLDRKPKDLSGGQRQRVAIGRAIVRKPEVFLFDEPLSNLDTALRVRMRYEFAKLHKDLKTTMIYVTHDQVEAMTLADRIVVLSAGKIEQVGSPLDLYEQPDNLFVAGFIGSPGMNFIAAEFVSSNTSDVTVRLNDGALVQCAVSAPTAKPGDKLTLGIRPEHMTRVPYANRLTAKVTFVESLGSVTYAYCAFPGVQEDLTCELNGVVRVQAGDTLELGVEPDRCYLFDAAGKAFKRNLPARGGE